MKISFCGALIALLACSTIGSAQSVPVPTADTSHKFGYYDLDGLAPFIVMHEHGRLLSKEEAPAVDALVAGCRVSWPDMSQWPTSKRYTKSRQLRQCVRARLIVKQQHSHMKGYRMLEDTTLEPIFPL